MIDLSTIRSLELIQNLTNVKSKDCLFGLLNETLTPMGSRILRSNILQPSTQEELLEHRWDAVEELAAKEDMFFETRKGETNEYGSRLPHYADTFYSIERNIRWRQAVNCCMPKPQTSPEEMLTPVAHHPANYTEHPAF